MSFCRDARWMALIAAVTDERLGMSNGHAGLAGYAHDLLIACERELGHDYTKPSMHQSHWEPKEGG